MSDPAPERPVAPPTAEIALAFLLLAVAALSWAGNFVVARAVEGLVPPFGLSLMRWTVAFLAILPFTARELWTKRAVLSRHWRIILILGLLGVSISNSFAYLGLNYTTVINGALVSSVIPMIILATGIVAYREPARARQLLGVVASLLGVAVIVVRGDATTLLTLRFNPGDLMLLVSAMSWSAYTLLLRRRPRDISPAALLTLLFAVGWITLLPLHLAFEAARDRPLIFVPTTIAAYLYVGLFPGFIAFQGWNRGVAVIGASRAGIFSHLVPVFAAVLAYVFLGEHLAAYHWVGAAFIALGIVLASL